VGHSSARVPNDTLASIDIAAPLPPSLVIGRLVDAVRSGRHFGRIVLRCGRGCARDLLNTKQQQRSRCQTKNSYLTHAYLPVENSVTALAETFRFEKAEEYAEEHDVHNTSSREIYPARYSPFSGGQ
jgi:hypothetical protein